MNAKKLTLFFILTALSVLLFVIKIPAPHNENQNHYDETLEGHITQVVNVEKESGQEKFVEQTLTIQVTKGSLKGQTLQLQNSDSQSEDAQLYQKDDDVMIQKNTDPESQQNNFTISDYVRRSNLYWLFGLFIAVVLLVSQKQGLESLIGMAFSFLVLFKWILPLLLAGYDPILSAVSGALVIIPITFYLSHGINQKTNLAIGGTVLTLLLTGLLAKLFVTGSHLSGLAEDAAFYLKSESPASFNFQGLLLAGIIISMLGILDDITISQASVAHQLKETKPNIRMVELFSRTMEVGKDHIASIVNTLILIYAGASLPLLMLFTTHAHPFSEVINYEFVAEEVVQTLVASIGLILAVPITTLLASFHSHKKRL